MTSEPDLPPTGPSAGGDALFLAGDFEGAMQSYAATLEGLPAGTERASVEHRYRRAQISAATGLATSEAQARVFRALFTARRLGAGPRPGEAGTPPPAVASGRAGPWHQVQVASGRLAGSVASFAMHQLTRLAGRAGTNGPVWTNWYTTGASLPRPVASLAQVLKLAHVREELFANNLVRTYRAQDKTGFVTPPPAPPEWATRWRTADGSWNHLDRDPDGHYDPMVGAAYTRFFRNIGDDLGLRAVHGREDPANDPVSVREVSRAVFAPTGGRTLAPFLNLWACVWIQFMNHDWVSHGTTTTSRTVPLPLAADDPLRQYGIDHLDVRTTPADLTRAPYEDGLPATYINEVTHWWDGSQIYGSDEDTQRSLRSFVGGRLTLDDDGLLPVDPANGVEQTGFNRNWWVALSTIHTLFAREHNAICDMLAGAHPDWDDDALFHTARLVNVAVMAKVHTVEWTPAVLPNETLSDGMSANWYGLVTSLFGGERKKVLEEIPITNREIGGILGNPHGTFAKYGLSEEFAAVYRLHSLLPDDVVVHAVGRDEAVEVIPLMATRHAASPGIVRRHGLGNLALSLGLQQCGALVAHNYPAALLDMTLPGEALVDLGALDLFRDRERGIPPYNQLRRELGLRPVPSFDALTDDTATAATLRRLYGTDADGLDRIDDMDLLVGTLCESHRPTAFGFGETLFQVFILNASWRLLGDRFFTDDYREGVYSAEGLAWVDATTMKSMLLRHFPELSATALANVTNAFEPWDAGRLDPARHPLRAFDRSLGPDPWAGDDPTVSRTGSA